MKRVRAARFHVCKDGVVLGYSNNLGPAERLAEFLGADVFDSRNSKGGRSSK